MLINLKNLQTAYINLEQFPNKNQTMINMLDNFGLNYFRVEGDESEEYDPISIAHVKALDAGADLILEDDCLPTEWYRDSFEVPDNADVVYLGISTGTTHVHSPKYQKISDSLYKLNDMTTVHAVLYITEAGKQWLRDAHDLTAEEKIGFDMATAKLMPTINVFGLNRPLWYQRDIPEQTNMTLDDALFSDEYSGGGFGDYPEPLIEKTGT
jgi:hypothetical protein